MTSNRFTVLALIGFALLALSLVRVPLPVAGPVPALWLVLLAELAALAVIACGIARSLGWRLVAA
jgi:hypothetical protein